MIMIPKPPKIENFAIPLPITGETRQIASQFAAQQPIREKAEQILLNTIAVSVVNNYLNMLGISTNLSNSDSWNPVMRLCNNVADLDIPGVGKLECRPIQTTSASSCQIPLEVWNLRIGYVVVQIDDSLKVAAILGFTPEVTTEELLLANLRPPEELIDRLHQFPESFGDNSLVNLGQWFNNIFETGWETVESILNPEQLSPAFGFRNVELPDSDSPESSTADGSVIMAKLIDLGVQLGARNVVLLLEISEEENGKIAVTLQLHPNPNDIYLPEAMELKVLEASDTVFMQAQARSRDNYIQLKFTGQPEETFKVEIILDDIKYSETFKL